MNGNLGQTWESIIRTLWDFMYTVMDFSSDLWIWFTTPQTYTVFSATKVGGINFVSNVLDMVSQLTGLDKYISFTIIPLQVFASGLIAFMLTLWIVKTFIPLA